ncbi:MAG: YciI family protein [Phycisphaerales bacterium JB059]
MNDPPPQFICFLEPAREDMPEAPTPEEADLARAHFEYCARLRDEGALLLAGRTQEAPFVGVLILEAPSREHAEQILAHDPGVAGGIFNARLQPYRVALHRPG